MCAHCIQGTLPGVEVGTCCMWQHCREGSQCWSGMHRMGLMPGAQALQSTAAANGLVLNDSTARTMVQSLAAALDCLERLMSQSAALPVPMPDSGIVMLCSRILSVDDSLTATGSPFPGMSLSKEATLGVSVTSPETWRLRLLPLHLQPSVNHVPVVRGTMKLPCFVMQWQCAGLLGMLGNMAGPIGSVRTFPPMQEGPHHQPQPTRCCKRHCLQCTRQPTACSGFWRASAREL